MTLINALKIRTSIVFSVSFPNKTFLSCFFLVVFIIGLYFLIHAKIVQIFVLTEELISTTGIATDEANAEIKQQPVTAEAKISKCSA